MDFLLQPPRKMHGLRPGCKFTPPPLDGSLTVSEMYDFHYHNNPDQTIFVYADSGKLIRLSYAEVVPAAYRAARYLAKLGNIDIETESRGSPQPLVAILAASDTITYSTTMLGMLRAEIPFFPISPRNSPEAIAHLIQTTRPLCILTSADRSIRDLLQSAIDQLQEPPDVFSMPVYNDIYTESGQFVPLPPRKRDLNTTRILVHTSGSSSLPKPIVWTDRFYLQTAIVPYFGAHDLCEQVIGCHAIAMFHGIGLNFIAWMPTTGLVMATFAPASPSTIATPDTVYKGIVDTFSSFAFSVPAFIEEWSRDPEKMTFFKTLSGVIYGGASLDKTIGDHLASEGVGIYSLYGLTEVGVIGAVLQENLGADWEYMTVNPHCAVEFVPVEDGVYELVVVTNDTQELGMINATFRGRNAYETSDLVSPHPSKPGLWKITGRKNELIVLSTGEKTNPVQLEKILCRHPQIADAIMFGRGRFQNGVLIQPTESNAFDPRDEQRLIRFRSAIWPSVEEMNRFAPGHSRLFKEMIIVTDPAKPFKYTPKGAPKRNSILADYEVEIDAVYNSVKEASRVEPPEDWSTDSTLAFVSATLESVLGRTVDSHEDIFLLGCDSLQATWIRNTILHALRTTSKASVSEVSQNFVYEHPNIASLSSYISTIIHSGSGVDKSTATLEYMTGLITRYTSDFPSCTTLATEQAPAGNEDVILVTGTTGALGSAILAKLEASDNVGRIFAFNRRARSGSSLLQRQEEALRNRGYDASIAKSQKVVLIEGDLTGKGLGVETSVEEELRKTVTHIIHTAWRVDFNLSLASFEDVVGGVRTLVDLALSSTRPTCPRLIFTSSIGVFKNNKSPHPLPEVPVEDPNMAFGQGYGESKWVAESILYEAAKTTPIRPIVVRVGQICGGVNGAWNTADWVPAIVKSSRELGCLPLFRGICSWIPLDMAASALVEMRNAESSTIHLVHPHPIRSRVLFEAISEATSLPLKPYAEWVKALEAVALDSDQDSSNHALQYWKDIGERIPAIKIIEFFRGGVKSEEDDDGGEAMGIPKLAMNEALKAAPVLRDTRPLNPDDARMWLAYWKYIGFF